MSVPVGISGLPDSSVPPLRQKENPENLPRCHSSGPEVPSWSAISLPPVTVLFGLFYIFPWFLIVISKRNRENYIHFIFPEEVSKFNFLKMSLVVISNFFFELFFLPKEFLYKDKLRMKIKLELFEEKML